MSPIQTKKFTTTKARPLSKPPQGFSIIAKKTKIVNKNKLKRKYSDEDEDEDDDDNEDEFDSSVLGEEDEISETDPISKLPMLKPSPIPDTPLSNFDSVRTNNSNKEDTNKVIGNKELTINSANKVVTSSTNKVVSSTLKGTTIPSLDTNKTTPIRSIGSNINQVIPI